MNLIVGWCLRNKSVVFLAILLLIESGVFATTRLNQELLPNVNFPVMLVSTPVPGAGRGGSQLIFSNLALTVIGGLATSTLLALLVVPMGYSLLEGARGCRKKKRYAG